jgi:hypothetical protein
MRWATLAATAMLAGLVSTGSAQEVTYDYDRSADFSRLKTYAWVDGTVLRDELNHKRIMEAVDRQLAAKGMRRVDASADPDVLVAYHALFDREVEIRGFSSGWAGYRYGGHRSGSARVEEILVGILTVDVIDARTKSIVWRGMATKNVDVNAKPEKRDKNLNKAAEKLFKNYPPKHNGKEA